MCTHSMLYKDPDNQMDYFPAVSSQHFFFFFLTISGLPASVLSCPVAPSDQLLCIMSLPRSRHLLLASSSFPDSHSSPLSLCSNPRALLFFIFSGTVKIIGFETTGWLTNIIFVMHTGFFLIKRFVLLPEATSFFPGRVIILISYFWSVSFLLFFP